MAGQACLESALLGGKVEAVAVVQVDCHLGAENHQQHEQRHREGELDQALAAQPCAPEDLLHQSCLSVCRRGVKTRYMISTNSGRTKNSSAGTVISTGARVIRSRYSWCRCCRS